MRNLIDDFNEQKQVVFAIEKEVMGEWADWLFIGIDNIAEFSNTRSIHSSRESALKELNILKNKFWDKENIVYSDDNSFIAVNDDILELLTSGREPNYTMEKLNNADDVLEFLGDMITDLTWGYYEHLYIGMCEVQ